MDRVDEYIITHSKSMSYAEMGDKLGINKSTVSRRAAALRESGKLDAKPRGADLAETASRERLQGCTISRAERLEALAELRGMLHDDLALAGGQGLARVSSEYRAVLAEIEALSAELDITMNARKVSADDVARIKGAIVDSYGETFEPDTVIEIADGVLEALDAAGVIQYTQLCKVSSTSRMMTAKKP